MLKNIYRHALVFTMVLGLCLPLVAQDPGKDDGETGLDPADQGIKFAQTGNQLAGSPDGRHLAAVTGDDYVCVSHDGGLTWKKCTSLGDNNWHDLAISTDGKRLAVHSDMRLYFSRNGGLSWQEAKPVDRMARCVAVSADGRRITSWTDHNDFMASVDGGETWLKIKDTGLGSVLQTMVASADGMILCCILEEASFMSGGIAVSQDGGANWDILDGSGEKYWADIACSADGNRLIAARMGEFVYIREKPWSTWYPMKKCEGLGSKIWGQVGISENGRNVAVQEREGGIFFSHDGGATWDNLNTDQPVVAFSVHNKKLILLTPSGVLVYKDNGTTWK